MAKKRNPNDATLRNVRAAKKEAATLKRRVLKLENAMAREQNLGVAHGLLLKKIVRFLERG